MGLIFSGASTTTLWGDKEAAVKNPDAAATPDGRAHSPELENFHLDKNSNIALEGNPH